MRILLSAYECHPDKGSEAGVGWNWAVQIARLGHKVWVLTRSENRSGIEAACSTVPQAANLQFLYFDLPPRLRRALRVISPLHAFWQWDYLYYALWQWGAYRFARTIHARERFDRIQHITIVSVRIPSFMGRLGAPFVFGPLAGGERTPWRLRWGYGWRGVVLEAIRDFANFLVRFDPIMSNAFRSAEEIVVTSQETLRLLPRRFRGKARVQLAIGIENELQPPRSEQDGDRATSGPVRLLYAGRLVYLKGLHLALAAFSRLLKEHPEAEITIVGDGPAAPGWRRLATRLGVAENVRWISWIPRTELLSSYRQYDIFIYPSLRDSGGMPVLEAMTNGLPVVTLALGGPGTLVDETCGRRVGVNGRSASGVIDALGDALLELVADPTLRERLSAGAIRRAREYSWERTIRRTYDNA